MWVLGNSLVRDVGGGERESRRGSSGTEEPLEKRVLTAPPQPQLSTSYEAFLGILFLALNAATLARRGLRCSNARVH
jgi:hypothetical protein